MLGAIFALTPTVGWALPLVWPAVLSAAGALGYKAMTATADEQIFRSRLTQEMEKLRVVGLDLDQVLKDIVQDEIGREQILRFTRDGGITIIFKRDMRGKFRVEVMGPQEMPPYELERIGQEFAQTVAQQFAYNKMAVEMEKRGASLIEEQTTENGDIILKMRRWD